MAPEELPILQISRASERPLSLESALIRSFDHGSLGPLSPSASGLF